MKKHELNWSTEKRKIKDIKDYERNPRCISKKDYKDLVNSIKKKGYHNLIRIDYDGVMIGGHQRLKALLENGYKHDDEIEVRIPERKLTEEEFKEEVIKDNLHSGTFDIERLANDYEAPQLIEWGIPKVLVGEFYEEDSPKKEKGKNKAANSKKCPNCGSEMNG